MLLCLLVGLLFTNWPSFCVVSSPTLSHNCWQEFQSIQPQQSIIANVCPFPDTRKLFCEHTSLSRERPTIHLSFDFYSDERELIKRALAFAQPATLSILSAAFYCLPSSLSPSITVTRTLNCNLFLLPRNSCNTQEI